MSLDRLTALFVAALALPFLLPPYVPFEPAWELSSGLGYLACAAFAFCCCLGWRRRVGPRPLAIPGELDLHRLAGHVVWLATLGHVASMLLFDPAVLEYLDWTMPWGIVAGLVATVPLIGTVLTREPRRRPVIHARRFPTAHVTLALLLLAFTIFHLLPGQAKFLSPWQAWAVPALLLLAGAPSIYDRLRASLGQSWRIPGLARRGNQVQIAWATVGSRVSLGLLLAFVFICATAMGQLMTRL